MDAWPLIEIRARLVFLFRALKVDTVLVYDPSALYERNPDHYITARAVEWAAGISATKWDYPEHFRAGVKPHAVKERYYFARGESPRGHFRIHGQESRGECRQRDARASRKHRCEAAKQSGPAGKETAAAR